MSFTSPSFLLFLPAVLLIEFIVPCRYRYIWLLISSYFFYLSWDIRYGLVIGLLTVISYVGGILLYKKHSSSRLILILIITLCGYVFFKAFNGMHLCSMSVVIPVGLSFYELQAISYIIDVYNDEIKCEQNLLRYALYLSFFPKILSGPIESTNVFMEDINTLSVNGIDYQKMRVGAYKLLWGYFLKLMLAERLTVVVNNGYEKYTSLNSAQLFTISLLYSFQLYADFCGYTYIAIGSAEILGMDLMENFKQPYLAMSVRDFWKRWHISLTKWLTKYIYISLGGNRKGKFRQYFNIFTVFFISGLWHGVSLHFIAWGCLHGLYQCIEVAISKYNIRVKKYRPISISKLMSIIWTFFFTNCNNKLDTLH